MIQNDSISNTANDTFVNREKFSSTGVLETKGCLGHW